MITTGNIGCDISNVMIDMYQEFLRLSLLINQIFSEKSVFLDPSFHRSYDEEKKVSHLMLRSLVISSWVMFAIRRPRSWRNICKGVKKKSSFFKRKQFFKKISVHSFI